MADGQPPVHYEKPATFSEAPMLQDRVAAGQLPPVDERLPEEPLVLGPGDAYGVKSIGQYCDVLRFDAVGPPDVRGATTMAVPFRATPQDQVQTRPS